MKNKGTISQLLLPLLLMVIIIIVPSCMKDNIRIDNGSIEHPGLDHGQIEGTLSPVEGSLVEITDLEVVTFANKAPIAADGSFSVSSVDSESFQMLLFNPVDSEDIVYIGLHDPYTDEVVANDTTTAIALTMLNPFMLYAEYGHVSEYIDEVRSNEKFDQLVSQIRHIHTSNPATLFDYNENPDIYQLGFQIMKSSMESLAREGAFPKHDDRSSLPVIEDAAGPAINFINPRHVWYASAIYPDGGEQDGLVHVDRVERLVSLDWAWPPIAMTDPKITPYELGNGDFRLHLAMGIDFSKIGDTDAIGRGTLLNTGQTVIYLMRIAIGQIASVNIITLPDHISISAGHIYSYTQALNNGDVPGLVMSFCDIIVDNSEAIAYWVWQEYHNDAASHFIKSIGGIIKNVSFVMRVLGFVNEEVPFIHDLIFAPREVTYYITQENGQIISISENHPPFVDFTIDPPAGVVDSEFVFDASATYDEFDSFEELVFRWDLYGDGTWDYDWGYHPEITHVYEDNGSYNVTLEVRNTEGLAGTASHRLNVGGGAGTASRVKLFMDNQPWDTNALIDMLEYLGFTYGTEDYQYQVIPSSEMATTPLIPGEDLVMIANDQHQGFYDNYAASQIRFNNFVYQGGSIFWGACDEGWAGGSMADAGVILPGNIQANFDHYNYNYVVNPDLPLVHGLPHELWHNFASHENFSNLPEGTTIYTVDEVNMPTLIEFNLGQGWALLSGQPLDHQYVHGDDMQDFLLRIVSHFTGQTITKDLPEVETLKPMRPSHLKESELF